MFNEEINNNFKKLFIYKFKKIKLQKFLQRKEKLKSFEKRNGLNVEEVTVERFFNADLDACNTPLQK